MDTLSYKTISANVNTVNKEWVVVDAAGLPLGRAAAYCTSFAWQTQNQLTPHVDCGDNVVVVNAAKWLKVNKLEQKEYIRHTGYPVGQRILNATQMHEKGGTRLMEKAVKGMLPKNKLGAELFRNLRVYAGNNHPHEAQNPSVININEHI